MKSPQTHCIFACSFRWLAFCSLAFCSLALSATGALGALTIDASCLHDPPPGVRVGQAVELVDADGTQALRFQREGIVVPLALSLTPESGTVRVRFQIPQEWPSESRGTLFHVGEVAHVHLSLFFNQSRLTAVYKGGEQYYASINVLESAKWEAGSWHEAVFSWTAKDTLVDFYLELDRKLAGVQAGHLIDEWPEVGYIGARRNGQIWQGTVETVTLSADFTLPRELRPGRRSVIVDGNHPQGTCYNFWSINNFTSQDMFADSKYGERVKPSKPFMKYVNCVRLLGGRHDGRNAWFKGVDEDGNADCDFAGMIQYLRGIQAAGYTPRIVLDNIPTALSEPGELAKYGNTRPAKDLKVWHSYVCQAVQAMVDAFGTETVSHWRFRVGTEPDLYPGHWQGTREEYLHHYDCTVDAVCSVLVDVEIGPGNILNPAHAEQLNAAGHKPWGLEIVDHCAEGKNRWTGATGTRMDFFECSWYGRVGHSIDPLDVAIKRIRDRLDRYPRFANTPIAIAEFAVLNDEFGRRLYGGDMTEWGASWYAAVADRIYDLNVQQVHEWAQATSGILHPRTYVMGMLEQMQGGQRLPVSLESDSSARCGAICCAKDDRYYILLYNHRPWRTPSIPEQVDLTLKCRRPGAGANWTVSEWGIDKNHGVFAHRLYEDCQDAGLDPLPDSPVYGGNPGLRFGPACGKVLLQNHAAYVQLALPVVLRQNEPLRFSDNAVKMTIQMPGHSVRFLIISNADR